MATRNLISTAVKPLVIAVVFGLLSATVLVSEPIKHFAKTLRMRIRKD